MPQWTSSGLSSNDEPSTPVDAGPTSLSLQTNKQQWLNYSNKGGGSLFPGETATWLEICMREYHLLETLRVHTHNKYFILWKYHITKASNKKKWLSALRHMQRLDDLCLLLSTDIGSSRWSELRIPWLTVEDPKKKVPDLYFKVVYPKLQVADVKAEVGSWDPAGSPNLTPAWTHSHPSDRIIYRQILAAGFDEH